MLGVKPTDGGEGELIAELSRDWVEALAARLIEDGRRLEGGWPGTLSEARSRLGNRLGTGGVGIPRVERERLAKALYADARTQWLAVAARCPGPPSDE